MTGEIVPPDEQFPDEQSAEDTRNVEDAKPPKSGWDALDELDPSPDRPTDDRLKGLPVPPYVG